MKTHIEVDASGYTDWLMAWLRISTLPDYTSLYCWSSIPPIELGDRVEIEHIWRGARVVWLRHFGIGRVELREGNALLACFKMKPYPESIC